MADNVQNTQQPNPYEGVSNPPDGGNVTSVSYPDDNDSTVSQTASQDIPPDQGSSQSPNAPTLQGVQGSPQQTVSAPQNMDWNQGVTKSPDLSKSTEKPQLGVLPTPVDPAIQKASKFHDIAEVLAGGPRYSYDVDPYGNLKRTQVPVSNSHLALAIAMEALGGAATGMAQVGPGSEGRAAAIGFQQGKQGVQQQDETARKQATEDYARRAQVLETNMRMYSTARQLSKADADQIDSYIGQYKQYADDLASKYPGYVHGPVKYSDFSKYHVTMQNAIPYKRTPRIGNDGKQVEVNGVPQWDIDYLVIDPNFKSTGAFNDPKVKEALSQMGQTWANNSEVDNTPFAAVMALNKLSQANQWMVARDHTFPNFYDVLDQSEQGSSVPTTSPELPDTIDKLATQAASDAKVDPAFVKGLIAQESSGDPNAVSPTGATGLMQLTQATAQRYGVTDRTNPVQNATAGAKYFKDLLDEFKDPKLAFAAYYSGPGAIKNGKIVDTKDHTAEDTQKYVDSMVDRVGLQDTKLKSPVERNDLAEWTKNHPTTPADVEKFLGALNGTDGHYGTALEHMRSSGQGDSANNIAAFLGGPDNIAKHDNAVGAMAKAKDLELQTNALEERSRNKQVADENAQASKQAMLDTIQSAQIPEGVMDMDPKDVVNNLKAQGVTLPASAINDAIAIAHYDAPLSVASNKLWYKDKSMNQQDMLDLVKMFNPDYRESNYTNLKVYDNPNSTPMKTIYAASGVANHLNILLQAAREINSKGDGSGNFPALNRLENMVNYHAGGDAYSRLAGVTNAINGEMGKVLSGGFAPDKVQVEALMKNMTPENSLKQIEALTGLYTQVMHGKVLPYDEAYSQVAGNNMHIRGIPESLNKLFQHYNLETPWVKNALNSPNSQQAKQAQIPQGYSAMTKDGKFVQDKQGKWVPNPNMPQPQATASDRAMQYIRTQ